MHERTASESRVLVGGHCIKLRELYVLTDGQMAYQENSRCESGKIESLVQHSFKIVNTEPRK